MSPRVYTRSFDWDEANTLHEQGWSYARLAEKYGVSESAIYFACRPEAYERAKGAAYEWLAHGGTCVDCGNVCTRAGDRCVACHRKWKVATSIQAREDVLRCKTCGEWKPDEAFPFSRSTEAPRRGRHGQCRPCQTIARREYRNRNKVPCANGCGTLVLAPNEQRASAKSKGLQPTGMCIPCFHKTRRAA